MRILQVLSHFDWEFGGPVRVVYDISRVLSKRGHQVTVFTTDEGMRGRLSPDRMIRPVGEWEIRYFRCDSYLLAHKFELHFSKEMQRALKSELRDFDVVHIHEWRSIPSIYIWHTSRKAKVPYVIQAHGTAPPKVAARNVGHTFSQLLYDHAIGRRITQNASRVIALHQKEAIQYSHHGIPSNKIDFLPNGIEISEFEDLPKRGSFKAKAGISDDARVILYLGRLNRIKGINVLIDAFARSASRRNSKLVIVGPDDGDRRSLETQARRLGINDDVIFTGALVGKDRVEAFVDADVYVLPSRYEAFSLTVFEALACRTPVVVSNECGVSDIVRNWNAGLVVRPNDTDISAAMDRLLSDQDLRTTLGQNGRALVKGNYSWETVVGKLEDIYARAIREDEYAREQA